MSPDKLAFIKGDESAVKPPLSNSEPAVRTIDLASTATAEANRPEQPPTRTATRRQRARSEATLPNASEVLDDLLVPLTTRLPHRLVQSLRRICLEQRLRHAKPDSIQEIVETAIESWLAKQ
ncbi:MAG TPA: hypothetical protein PKC18_03930 [Lacipirellulaceae bacterium]|nr:hypothetical protein [Lacipirellulaceae bacterium]